MSKRKYVYYHKKTKVESKKADSGSSCGFFTLVMFTTVLFTTMFTLLIIPYILNEANENNPFKIGSYSNNPPRIIVLNFTLEPYEDLNVNNTIYGLNDGDIRCIIILSARSLHNMCDERINISLRMLSD